MGPAVLLSMYPALEKEGQLTLFIQGLPKKYKVESTCCESTSVSRMIEQVGKISKIEWNKAIQARIL